MDEILHVPKCIVVSLEENPQKVRNYRNTPSSILETERMLQLGTKEILDARV